MNLATESKIANKINKRLTFLLDGLKLVAFKAKLLNEGVGNTSLSKIAKLECMQLTLVTLK